MFNPEIFSSLESFLGDVQDEGNVFSFEHILRLDRQELYPAGQVAALDVWGVSDYFIPECDGGKLRDLTDLLFLIRLIARRDLTTAIAYGGTFLGAVTVWIGGSPALRETVKRHIREGKKIAFALTERRRGSDLLASDTSAFYNPDQQTFELTGEKWLYNHASKSHYTTVLAKRSGEDGPRSCSLFYVARPDEQSVPDGGISTMENLTRIHTVGLRGLDLGGVTLRQHVVNERALIGKPGSGLELALEGLQITRALCTGFSLGSLDTLLRCTAQFCQERILYKRAIQDMPIVRAKLRDAFLDMIIAESLSLAACRTAQVFPSQFGLISAVIKASVPAMVESHTRELASVLGARSYISSETEYRIFQKQSRDNAIIGIFDGNSYVNYQYVLQQMKTVFSLPTLSQPSAELRKVYTLSDELPVMDFTRLAVVGKGRDDLALGLTCLMTDLERLEADDIPNEALRDLISGISFLAEQMTELRQAFVKDNPTVNNPFVIEARTFDYAYNYAKLHAGIAVACMIFYNREKLHVMYSWWKLLKLCVCKVSSSFRKEVFHPDAADEELVAGYITSCYQGSFLFSLFPLKVL